MHNLLSCLGKWLWELSSVHNQQNLLAHGAANHVKLNQLVRINQQRCFGKVAGKPSISQWTVVPPSLKYKTSFYSFSLWFEQRLCPACGRIYLGAEKPAVVSNWHTALLQIILHFIFNCILHLTSSSTQLYYNLFYCFYINTPYISYFSSNGSQLY